MDIIVLKLITGEEVLGEVQSVNGFQNGSAVQSGTGRS
jgi:hypothetical protein